MFLASARSNLDWAQAHIRRHGMTPTVKKVVTTLFDSFYDWKHGTETQNRVWSDRLVTPSQNKEYANCYQPSKARPFMRLLAELKLPRNVVFVDFGAGKGRVLLLAAEYRFQRVVGVEFCSNLCAQARQNVAIFRKSRPHLPEIDVVHSDVVDYAIPNSDIVFYLNNSFELPVLSEVLKNIRRSLAAAPRRIWMIYSPPVYDSIVQSTDIFSDIRPYEFGGVEFKVYSAGPRSGNTGA